MTDACLKLVGKQPSENDRLARCEIASENTDEQDLIMDVGTKSRSPKAESYCGKDCALATSSIQKNLFTNCAINEYFYQ